MSDDIIKHFFLECISESSYMERSSEQDMFHDRIDAEQAYFAQFVEADDHRRWDELDDLNNALRVAAEADSFAAGFKMGAELMLVLLSPGT